MLSGKPIRSSQMIFLNAKGCIQDASSDPPGQYVKHIFLLTNNDFAYPLGSIERHYLLPEWCLAWDHYVGDQEQRNALRALIGGAPPQQIYQAELKLVELSRCVPKNGGGVYDGPFSLTTDVVINNGGLLKFYLMRLDNFERNAVLQSSFLRTTGFRVFP